ncbi:MAG: methyltransferase domain-containing protein [Tannerella sp.]|nr:methyltransferase domain-containing protein [Tannerella sp.]
MKHTIKKLIKDFTPPLIWRAISRIRHHHIEQTFWCPVCNQKVKQFSKLPDYYNDMMEKYEYIHSIYCTETINSKAYSCPHCYASDRDRLYAIYFNKRFQSDKKKEYAFLDIAPSKPLADFVRKHDFIRYRSADLYMEDVDDKVDITDMYIYPENNFDIILCSHVLEHIENDRKAMSELYRILKPGGFAIVMVPILLTLNEDFENSAYTTEAERWKYFGQNDHVRLYSKSGFLNKLSQTGFKTSQLGIEYFGKDVFETNGIHPRSILYIVEK